MVTYDKVKLGLRPLSTENLSYLCRSTLQLIAQEEEALTADPGLAKAFKTFENHLDAFDDAKKFQQQAPQIRLSDLDRIRDRDFNDFRLYVRLQSRHRLENRRKAAETLHLLLQPYAEALRKSHSEQTNRFRQLLKDLDSREYKALITQIGAADYVSNLKDSHQKFEAAALNQMETSSQKRAASRLELRRLLEDDYNNIYAYLLSLEHFGYASYHRPLLAAFNKVRRAFVDKHRKK